MKSMRTARNRVSSRLLLATAGSLWLASCAQSVIVESEFPAPLVERLPVRIGLILDENLQAFQHYEEIPQQSTWTIELGAANIAMLKPLFETMFIETRAVDSLPVDQASGLRLDGVLQPVLEKFEFDVPLGSRDDFVEVWMQYRLNLYEPDGALVAEWPVSGYGKAELTRGSQEDSVSRAAIVAMREVGATISTKFAEQPEVSYWLEERQNAAAVSVENRLTD